jgi:hypothetical protein
VFASFHRWQFSARKRGGSKVGKAKLGKGVRIMAVADYQARRRCHLRSRCHSAESEIGPVHPCPDNCFRGTSISADAGCRFMTGWRSRDFVRVCLSTITRTMRLRRAEAQPSCRLFEYLSIGPTRSLFLPYLSVAAAQVHGTHPTDLFLTCKSFRIRRRSRACAQEPDCLSASFLAVRT